VIARRFGLAAAAAVALSGIAPAVVGAASTPSAKTLRAAMADPVETDFVEMPDRASGTLEGSFDAEKYAQAWGSDSKSHSSVLRALRDYGFVAGYGRDWYKSKQSDEMEELIMVFNQDWGAEATASTSRTTYSTDQNFQSFFEPHLNNGAYGVTERTGGYYWSVVIFTKGNDMFAVERGSPSGYPTTESIAQAQKAFDVAPARIHVAAQPIVPAAFSRSFRLFAVGALVLMLIAACAICVTIFVVFAPRMPKVPAAEAQTKP
jgi:hypothetical protein